ncbi:MAG: tetratricopeptide repeat protein [Planctomycetia bacterium]|nr:tetratricopeptide repeat protein [Planctomycetia bacterium]
MYAVICNRLCEPSRRLIRSVVLLAALSCGTFTRADDYVLRPSDGAFSICFPENHDRFIERWSTEYVAEQKGVSYHIGLFSETSSIEAAAYFERYDAGFKTKGSVIALGWIEGRSYRISNKGKIDLVQLFRTSKALISLKLSGTETALAATDTAAFFKSFRLADTVWTCNAPTSAAEYVARGKEYVRNKMTERALSDFARALEIDSECIKALEARADCYASLQRYEKAAADCEKIVQCRPNEARSYCIRARVLAGLDKKKAWEDYTHALKIAPYSSAIYYDRGALHINLLNEVDQALADFTQAILLDPTNEDNFLARSVVYQRKGQISQANADKRSAAALRPVPPDEYTKELDAADRAFAQDRFEESLVHSSKAVHLWKSAAGYRLRAMALRESGEYQNALEEFRHAVELLNQAPPSDYDEQLALLYAGMGKTFFQLGDYERVVRYSYRANNNDREAPIAWDLVISSYLAQAQNAKAAAAAKTVQLDQCDAAIHRNPQCAFHFLARSMKYLDKGDYAQASTDVAEAVRLGLEKALPMAIYLRARISFEKKDFAAAITDFDEAIRLGVPDELANAYLYRGRAWQSLGDEKKSTADHDEAIRIDPSNYYAYARRGELRFGRKEYAIAIEDYTKAISLCEDAGIDAQPSGWIYHARGHAWYRQKQYQRALEDLIRSFTLNGDDGGAYNLVAWIYATCLDEKYRHGGLALDMARTACKKNTDWKNLSYLDTFAAALAEVGDFDKALEIQKLIVDAAPPSDKAEYQTRLKLYAAKKPFRE